LLTCQVAQDASVQQAPAAHPDQRILNTVEHDGGTVTPADAELIRRGVCEFGRVDARLARLAVSSVCNPAERPVLRVDTVLLGAGEWVGPWLRHCGLAVRQAGDTVVVEPPDDSTDAGSLRRSLRDALVAIRAALERCRANLRGTEILGAKAVYGRLEQVIADGPTVGAVPEDDRACVDFSQGQIERTNCALDVAIDGCGLFVLEINSVASGFNAGTDASPRVRQVYTRDGRFRCRDDGVLVSCASPDAVVAPALVLPPGAVELVIASDGRVLVRRDRSGQLTSAGRLRLAWFERPQYLRPLGSGAFVRTAEAGNLIEGPPTESGLGCLVQGSVEQSNVAAGDCWTRLCRLEDARQIVLAMLAELDEPDGPANSVTSVCHSAGGKPGSAARSSTVAMPLPMPPCDAVEPPLLGFLCRRGVDAAVVGEEIVLPRSGATAAALVEYSQFLRRRLEVIGENIVHASTLERGDGLPGPYRRKLVRLDARGLPEVVEDPSPGRVVWATGEAASAPAASEQEANARPDGARQMDDGPELIEYPNVDLEMEMADSEAVMQEHDAVRGAIRALDAEAVPALTRLLPAPRDGGREASERSSPSMRYDAVWMLGQIGPEAKPAVPMLIALLSESDWELRKAAAAALERIAPQSEPVLAALVEAWTAALGSQAASERYQAAVALGRLGPRLSRAPSKPLQARIDAAVQSLAGMADDPASGAARALGQLGKAAASAVPALVHALGHSQVHVRLQAADALGRMGPAARDAVPDLVRALRDAQPEVRWRAAASIGMIGAGDSGCGEALAELLRDQDEVVRDRAAEALGKLGPVTAGVAAQLRAASAGEPPRGRVWPLFALALAVDRTATPIFTLSRTAAREGVEVRRMACEALGKLGRLAAPAVPFLMQTAQEQDSMLAAAAIEALAAVGPQAAPAVPVLSVALGHEQPLIRRRAAEALGRIGPQAVAAAPALTERLHDDSEVVVIAAAEALGRIGPAATESAEALRSRRTDGTAAVRRAAAAAMKRIAADSNRPLRPTADRPPALAGAAEDAAEP
jgi:HEAT repeat protein/flagellar basal body rod protein FlgG